MNAQQLLATSRAASENRALKKAVATLNRPDIRFGGETRYAYKGWIPTLIPFIQKSSGIYDTLADPATGRLPAEILVPALTTKPFQMLTPKDHPFLLLDIKVSAYRSLDGTPGPRFYSPVTRSQQDGFRPNLLVVTANYTLTTGDFAVDGDATNGNFTITLPAAALNPGGTYIIAQISGSNTVTLDAAGAETITDFGAAPALTLNLNGRGAVILRTDGVSNWNVIAASQLYAFLRTLAPDNEQIAIALTATSPGGKSIYGGLANVSGLSNGEATVSAQPHLERIPLSNLQYGGSGKGALRTAILFPKDGMIKVEVENDSTDDYFVNGLVSGYRITR